MSSSNPIRLPSYSLPWTDGLIALRDAFVATFVYWLMIWLYSLLYGYHFTAMAWLTLVFYFVGHGSAVYSRLSESSFINIAFVRSPLYTSVKLGCAAAFRIAITFLVLVLARVDSSIADFLILVIFGGLATFVSNLAYAKKLMTTHKTTGGT